MRHGFSYLTLLSVYALMLFGCDSRAATVAAKSSENNQLHYIERVTGDAPQDAALPLVVILHGRGDVPDNFTKRLSGYSSAARFVYLEAPIDEGKGRGWFTFDRGPGGWSRTTDKVKRLAEQVSATTRALIKSRPTRGKPTLTGFSQGAMVVYAAILAYPDQFGAALPVSGALFDSLLPDDMSSRGPKLPPVVAFHGEDDPVIPPRASREAVAMLKGYGAPAELRLFPEVPHWIMGEMKSDLLEEIERCTSRAMTSVLE